jgi:hypothetical protein
MNKEQPTGCIARCKCGAIIGAVDFNRMDRKDAGKLLGKWLYKGYTLEPRFGDCWEIFFTECHCNSVKVNKSKSKIEQVVDELFKIESDNGYRIEIYKTEQDSWKQNVIKRLNRVFSDRKEE